jgi:hypothetical protein
MMNAKLRMLNAAALPKDEWLNAELSFSFIQNSSLKIHNSPLGALVRQNLKGLGYGG